MMQRVALANVSKLINLTRETLKKYCSSLQENVKNNTETSSVVDANSIDSIVTRLVTVEPPDLRAGFKNTDFPVVHLLLSTCLHEHISTEAPDPQENGLLYLYDGQVQDYRSDQIDWEPSKMNIKIIVYLEGSRAYRLKNKRDEQGVAVMRRQTWTGRKNGIEWRKHEYKIFRRVTMYYQRGTVNSDTAPSLSSRDSLELQDFPVLVHYFQSDSSTSSKRANSTRPAHHQTEETTSAKDESSVATATNSKKRSRTSKKELASQQHSVLSSQSPSFLPTVVVTNTIASSANTSSWKNSPNGEQNYSPPSSSASSSRPPHTESFEMPLPSPPLLSELITDVPLISSPSQLAALESIINATEVISFSPDCAPADEPTKVIVICRFPSPPQANCVYVAVFGEVEVPVRQLADHAFELFTPRCIAGVREFFLASKVSEESSSGNLRNSSPSWLQMSSLMQFFFTPSYPGGHLCLSNLNLETNESIRNRLTKFRQMTRELDLAYNSLSNVDFLASYHRLKTLIIDNNKISSATVFPPLPKLQTLFVNSNLISQLDLFLDHVCASFPNLKYLSMLDNEANPFQRFPHHYYNYRIYVISRLKRLTQLDSAPVTDEERYHAASLAQE